MTKATVIMKISFPYETESSDIFGSVKRPIAEVSFWSSKRKRWLRYTMIVDTGADYTLLPYSAAEDLGIDLEKDCTEYRTFGIGGSETVYLIRRYKVKIGDFEMKIPIGFLGRDDVPPLLGREKCLNNFYVLFSKFITWFSIS